MIDQTAGEIFLDSNTNADRYVHHQRQSLATTVGRQQSLMHSDEMHGAVFDLPSPAQQVVHRQSIGEQLSAVRERMAAMKAAQVKAQSNSISNRSVPAARPTVPIAREEIPEDAFIATVPEPAAVSRFSNPEKSSETTSPAAMEHASSNIRSMPSSSHTNSLVHSARGVPSIITTGPSTLDSTSQLSGPPLAGTSQSTTTQPATPVDSPERAPGPSVALPTEDQPASTPAATPTPRAPDATSQHHSYFPNLLTFNPFHRRTPQGSSSSSDHNDSGSEVPLNPLTAAAKAIAPLPITAQANPYHHSPTAPLGLYIAEHTDPAVQERAQVIRAAMQMERKKMLQEQAAALERETRRARRQSGAIATAAGKAAGGMRKGWFG